MDRTWSRAPLLLLVLLASEFVFTQGSLDSLDAPLLALARANAEEEAATASLNMAHLSCSDAAKIKVGHNRCIGVIGTCRHHLSAQVTAHVTE